MAAFTVILAICMPFVLLARYLLALIVGSLTFDGLFFGGMLFILLTFLLGFYFLGLYLIHPKLTIYEHGLTRLEYPIFTSREGDFVAFADVESFKVSGDRRTCLVMLHSKNSYMLWDAFNPKHIRPVVDALRKHGIPETD